MKCRREIFSALLELDLWLVQIEWFNINQIPSARQHKVERVRDVKTPAGTPEVTRPQGNNRVCVSSGDGGAQSQAVCACPAF